MAAADPAMPRTNSRRPTRDLFMSSLQGGIDADYPIAEVYNASWVADEYQAAGSALPPLGLPASKSITAESAEAAEKDK